MALRVAVDELLRLEDEQGGVLLQDESDSICSVAEKAQQEPQWPWSLTGLVAAPVQPTEPGSFFIGMASGGSAGRASAATGTEPRRRVRNSSVVQSLYWFGPNFAPPAFSSFCCAAATFMFESKTEKR